MTSVRPSSAIALLLSLAQEGMAGEYNNTEGSQAKVEGVHPN